MAVHIIKEQIKIIPEDQYAVEPTYDSTKVTVLDVTDWSLDSDQGIMTEETLASAGETTAIAGAYTMSGNTTVPVRMSQLSNLNIIGMGEGDTKTVTITDSTGSTVYTMNAGIAFPSQKMLNSYTIYHLLPEPEANQAAFGVVFSNLSATWDVKKIQSYSFDINAAKDRITLAPAIGWDPTTQPESINEPMPVEDYVRSLDAALYGDMQLVKYDSTNNILINESGDNFTPVDGGDGYYTKCTDVNGDSWSIIDVLPVQETGATINDIFDEIRYIIGKRIVGISTIKMDMKIETDNGNAHRLGDRFAMEYPMRKVIKQTYSGSFTADFAKTASTGEIDSFQLYNLFYNGAKTETVIEPTSTGIGKLNLVIKVGSAFDIKATDAQSDKRVPYAFGFNATDPLMHDANINTTTLGSPRRGIYIIPNVILEKATRKDSAGQLKTVDYTFKVLPGSLGESTTYDFVSATQAITLTDLRAIAFTWLV